MQRLDPDLAFAFGEERVLRAVSRGALWLTTLLTAVALSLWWFHAPVRGAELLTFLAPGALYGAYAVARGAGLVPAALAAGVSVLGLGLAAVCFRAVGLWPFGLADEPFSFGLLGFWWAATLGVALLVGVPVSFLRKRA